MYSEIRDELVEMKRRIEGRLGKISADRMGDHGPLSADSEEQATELQNEEVLDQLDVDSRERLIQIDAALNRMDSNTYGICVECGEPISVNRLKALPFAARCIACESAKE